MIKEGIEKQYYFEFERSDRLNRQATFSATLGAILFPLLGLNFRELVSPHGIALLSYVLNIFATACAIMFSVRFFNFFGRPYFYVTPPTDVSEIYFESKEYDKNVWGGAQVERLERSLTESFARSAAANRLVNHGKSQSLLFCNKALMSGLILASFSYVLGKV